MLLDDRWHVDIIGRQDDGTQIRVGPRHEELGIILEREIRFKEARDVHFARFVAEVALNEALETTEYGSLRTHILFGHVNENLLGERAALFFDRHWF